MKLIIVFIVYLTIGLSFASGIRMSGVPLNDVGHVLIALIWPYGIATEMGVRVGERYAAEEIGDAAP